MKRFIYVLVISNFALSAKAQVGINTNTPSATLDIVAKKTDGSTSEGLIPPRLTGEQIKNGDGKYLAQQTGTLIYATNAVTTSSPKTINITSAGLYYFDGVIWQKITNAASSFDNPGDLKNSFQTNDHNGWYLLDGRLISDLPLAAQVSAAALNFSNNIPDARDRVLKTKSTTENLGNLGGTNNLSITQSNLPNIQLNGNITGTAATNGAHTHAAVSGGYLLGGTQVGNNGTGNLQGNATYPGAWAGIGRSDNTASSGDHTHTVSGTATVSTGGSGTTLDNRSPYITVNTFIYLGQ